MTEPEKGAGRVEREAARALEHVREAQKAARVLLDPAASTRPTWRDYERVIEALAEAGVVLEKVEQARMGPITVVGLPEEKAVDLARRAVEDVRKELSAERASDDEGPFPSAPSPEEVRARREERRRREAS